MSEATVIQKAACQSIGTKQCAAICLQHSCLIPLGDCPSASTVWTQEAIVEEYKRRSNGPLKDYVVFEIPQVINLTTIVTK